VAFWQHRGKKPAKKFMRVILTNLYNIAKSTRFLVSVQRGYLPTTGSDERTWLDTAGDPRSVEAHIQERYTRLDHNHMQMTITVDDPKIYTKPFVLGTNKYLLIPTQETEQQFLHPLRGFGVLQYDCDPAFGVKPKQAGITSRILSRPHFQ
jgi:hypothetical protein